MARMVLRRAAFSLRRKLGLIFGLLSLMLLSVSAVTYLEVRQIGGNVRRLFEENREAELTRSLLLDLQGAQRIQRLLAAAGDGETAGAQPPVGVLDQVGHLQEARRTLMQLSAGPGDRDPSDPGHESSEQRIYHGLLTMVDDIERRARDSGDGLHHQLAEALLLAESLSRETHEEAREAGEALDRHGRELVRIIGLATALAIATLVFVSWFVARHVLRPIRALQEGARRIGAGQLDHRISIRSPDEIGDLSGEINRMAQRLGASHQELEDRVAERTRQLIRADRLAGLGTLAAGIAHEINNPLASIASCAEGLLHRHRSGAIDSQELVEYLGIIAKEAYRAHDIAARMLQLAHQDPGETELMSVADAIREASIMLQHRLEQRSVRLRQHLEPDLPRIEGNPKEWKQVVLNLLNNAIDASPPESAIDVTCRRVDDRVQVVFQDQGGGIAEENLEHVFSPFFTTKAPGEGTGIGLSIVHGILEAHGASIDVVNAEAGARFRIEFPIPAAEGIER
jgi:signal transduction histidine kinase